MDAEKLSPQGLEGYMQALAFVARHMDAVKCPAFFDEAEFKAKSFLTYETLKQNLKVICVLSAIGEDFSQRAIDMAPEDQRHAAKEQYRAARKETRRLIEVCHKNDMFQPFDDSLSYTQAVASSLVAMGLFGTQHVADAFKAILPGVEDELMKSLEGVNSSIEENREHFLALMELVNSPDFEVAYSEILKQCSERAARIERL